MKKKSMISALTLAAFMGAVLTLPATASAHGVEKKRVKIIETTEYRGGDDHHRHGKRHHRVDHDRHGRGHHRRHAHRKHHGHRGHEHRHVRREHRHEYYEPRQVRREPERRHRDDGIRVRIDYDFWL